MSFGLMLAWVTAAAQPAAADTVLWKTVGAWDVSFYPWAKGCQAFVVFEEDTAFFIGFDRSGRDLSLDVTLLDQRWSTLKPDEHYDISVKFGRETPWNMSMRGLEVDGFSGLHILIDAQSDQAEMFVEEFQRKTRMEWFHKGDLLGRYRLRGSARAFHEVKLCQQSYLAEEIARAEEFVP